LRRGLIVLAGRYTTTNIHCSVPQFYLKEEIIFVFSGLGTSLTATEIYLFVVELALEFST
jgi:hypothetical protein